MCDLCCTAHRFSLNHTTKLQIRNSVITLWSYYTIWNYTDLTFPETVNLSDNPCTHSGFHFYIHVKQIQLFKRSTSFMNLNLRWGEALCCWIVCSDVFFFNEKKNKKNKIHSPNCAQYRQKLHWCKSHRQKREFFMGFATPISIFPFVMDVFWA